jgi:hypothetical protein
VFRSSARTLLPTNRRGCGLAHKAAEETSAISHPVVAAAPGGFCDDCHRAHRHSPDHHRGELVGRDRRRSVPALWPRRRKPAIQPRVELGGLLDGERKRPCDSQMDLIRRQDTPLFNLASVVQIFNPASRPKTDCRNIPTRACRPFLPVRASASISPAIALRPSASPSSR